jgi:hypothetical protein
MASPLAFSRLLLRGSLTTVLLAAGLAPAPAARGMVPAGEGRGVMKLIRTRRQLPISLDPIWELQLLIPGQKLRSYPAVVGRASRQDADRDRLGSQAPLPRGTYRVTEIEPMRPEDPPELGRFLWIGLEPAFSTDRKALGIHHDPSAGRGRSSGTNGCIGLINGNDLLSLGALLARHGTQELVVVD